MGGRGVFVRVGAGVGLLTLLCAGCAVGRSPSMAAAPMRLVYTTFGDLEVSLAGDGSYGEAIPLVGDFQAGVDGYDIVGGNALLPVRRPDPLVVAAGPAAVSVALPGLDGGPLAASATLSGLAGASVAASLAAPTPTSASGASLAATIAATSAPPAGVVADLAAPSPTSPAIAATAAPPVAPPVSATVAPTPATVAVTTPVSPTLTVQGPVLNAPTVAAPVAAATALGGASVNSLLNPLRGLP